MDITDTNCLNKIVQQITYHRDNKEYFLEPQQILFFEASDDNTYAHTRQHIYRVRHRLYQLETILPNNFLRVSKAGIVNVNYILSFATTVGTTGIVEFSKTDKKLHISRQYIKVLRSALKARSQNHGKTTKT
ncbi:LytTR family transcriptional regulator [Candidatus Saccharibacteria bacterium]|nr:LytTR family transcriptional regulator [Candidatus Saccharibacteria bacterium]